MSGPGAFWYSGGAEAQLLAGAGAAYSITGAVTVSLTPAATMLEGRVIAGAVTVTLTPAAAMVEGRGIVGSVTVTLTPAAVMLEGRTLAGAVTVVLTPAASMTFTPAGAASYSIVGAVTITLTPAAVMEYEAFVAPPSAPPLGGGGAWRRFKWPEDRLDTRKPKRRIPKVRVEARLVVQLPDLAVTVAVQNPAPVRVRARLARPGLPAFSASVRIVTPFELLEELEALVGVLDD